jgi:acetyltransferase-like isoleucine patch superfamily enzyme
MTPSPFSRAAIRAATETPWKARNELERYALLPLARLQFALSGVPWPEGARIYGLPIIQRHRNSNITLGPRAELRSTVRSNPLGPHRPCILSTRRPDAVLTVGVGFGMTGGSVVCEERITIGDNVWIGANSTILDTDFHPLVSAERLAFPLDGATAPVTIEDNVFIGMNALVLKGVTLGAGCVVGAGSVVVRDVPAGTVVAGNPARVVRTLDE